MTELSNDSYSWIHIQQQNLLIKTQISYFIETDAAKAKVSRISHCTQYLVTTVTCCTWCIARRFYSHFKISNAYLENSKPTGSGNTQVQFKIQFQFCSRPHNCHVYLIFITKQMMIPAIMLTVFKVRILTVLKSSGMIIFFCVWSSNMTVTLTHTLIIE